MLRTCATGDTLCANPPYPPGHHMTCAAKRAALRQPDVSPERQSRLLALGDSYTIGEGVCADQRWPALLQQQLRADGTKLTGPEIIAVTGWTCAELDAGINAAHLTPPYALVTLCIGVNNEYDGIDAAVYQPQFRQLLQRAVALTGDHPERVLVVSIPDWSLTRFAREHGRDTDAERAAIGAYNAAAHEETAKAGAVWVDVTAISRRRPDELAADGLHPSAAQYRRWLVPIHAAARQTLANG